MSAMNRTISIRCFFQVALTTELGFVFKKIPHQQHYNNHYLPNKLKSYWTSS